MGRRNWEAWILWRAQLALERAKASGETDAIRAARRWVHHAYREVHFARGLGMRHLAGMEVHRMDFIFLGDVVKLAVHTEPTDTGAWRAWCPSWPGIEAGGATEEGAKVKLRYCFESEMAQGRVPTLPVSP